MYKFIYIHIWQICKKFPLAFEHFHEQDASANFENTLAWSTGKCYVSRNVPYSSNSHPWPLLGPLDSRSVDDFRKCCACCNHFPRRNIEKCRQLASPCLTFPRTVNSQFHCHRGGGEGNTAPRSRGHRDARERDN